jgi:predicted amidohydrolase
MPSNKSIRLAVAQSTAAVDPRDTAGLRAAGRGLRRLMREAHEAGARLVHFPEGATCSPDKHVMSIDGPDQVGPSDWDRFAWDVLRQELQQIATLARELSLWTVVGSVHRLTPPHRPHNSLYVISDRGEVVTRYDERMLSNTKLSYMYTPGSTPVTFEVDGVRFGCLLGMEVHFPELFLEYERLDVDGVLFSTTGSPDPDNRGVFATEAQANAGTYAYWVSFAATTQDSVNAPSGIVSPQARWLARCGFDESPGLAVVDLDDGAENLARPWRRTARDGIYYPHIVHDDPRSSARGGF